MCARCACEWVCVSRRSILSPHPHLWMGLDALMALDLFWRWAFFVAPLLLFCGGDVSFAAENGAKNGICIKRWTITKERAGERIGVCVCVWERKASRLRVYLSFKISGCEAHNSIFICAFGHGQWQMTMVSVCQCKTCPVSQKNELEEKKNTTWHDWRETM